MENGQWPHTLHFQVIVDMEVPTLPTGRQVAIGEGEEITREFAGFLKKKEFLRNCPILISSFR
jgi:hypothetical protein